MFVVTGATGNTGSVVAATLLDAGKEVTLIVRSAAKAKPWKERGARVVEADITDADALARAFDGASGAYLMMPSAQDTTDFLGSRAAIASAYAAAAARAALPHAVFLSSLGAQHESGTGPIRALRAAEGTLGGIPNLTVLRAAWFLENFLPSLDSVRAEGVLQFFLAPEIRISMIATRDIGAAAAELLLHPPAASTVVEVAGPEDYTLSEIASVLSQVAERDVHYEEMPPQAAEAVLRQFGASEDAARLYVEMLTSINNGLFLPTGNLRRMAISAREFFLAQSVNAAAAHSY